MLRHLLHYARLWLLYFRAARNVLAQDVELWEQAVACVWGGRVHLWVPLHELQRGAGAADSRARPERPSLSRWDRVRCKILQQRRRLLPLH